MKTLITLTLALSLWSQAAVCNPYGECKACKDCSKCRYCSGKNNSATCSVCRAKKAEEKKPTRR